MKVSISVAKEFIRGNENAVSEVYHKYKGLLYFIISTYVKTKEDCEDVYQDVFLAILDKRVCIGSAINLHSYLCSTAKNMAINFAKQSSKYVPLDKDEEVASIEKERIDDLLPYDMTKDEKIVIGYKLCLDYMDSFLPYLLHSKM